jgi:catechol 2,3-dioxygenase-like lactoylglutathione lyase family enzyme
MRTLTQAFIEHVNITVGDPDRTAAMLEAVFGWKERWRGPSQLGGRTIHVGTESHYLAVYAEEGSDGSAKSHIKGVPLNHIGIQVDDLDAVEAKVIQQGLTPFSHGDYEPGRRFYFFDEDGIEFEIVSYAG